MRFRRVFFILFLILIVTSTALAELTITVQPSKSWGDIKTEEIKALCYNVASHFQDVLREEHSVQDIVNVYYDTSGPFVRLGGNRHNIAISARGDFLDQFTYQFSHEFCHIIQNTEDNVNLWFQESICMLASIWVLREMTETWEHHAPYPNNPNWVNYRHNFLDYANRNRKRYSGTAAEWLAEHEDFLRNDYYKNRFTHHLLVAQLSDKFLPLFEKHPEGWNTISQMPATSNKISKYMVDWYNNVAPQDKFFVELLATEMDIEVSPVMPAIASADFTNLTFAYQGTDAITPINPSREWDGWTQGVWAKTPDGRTTPKSHSYFEFSEMDEFSHWLYSHAPATLIYDISGINATSFSTLFLLPNPHCGGEASMEFRVFADDTEIYRKPLYLDDSGEYVEIKIPLGTQEFTISVGDLGDKGCDHFVLGEPKLYDNDDSIQTVDMSTQTDIDADVNDDGYVDLHDVMIVRSGIRNSVSYDTDVNNDGVTNEIDVMIVKWIAVEAIAAASPPKLQMKLTTWGSIKQK